MKTILSALLVSAFIASPAVACSWMKTAEKQSTYTASVEEQTEDAITTFDPADKPAFEREAAKVETEELVEEEAAE